MPLVGFGSMVRGTFSPGSRCEAARFRCDNFDGRLRRLHLLCLLEIQRPVSDGSSSDSGRQIGHGRLQNDGLWCDLAAAHALKAACRSRGGRRTSPLPIMQNSADIYTLPFDIECEWATATLRLPCNSPRNCATQTKKGEFFSDPV
jgi:hypothetical protein